MSHCIVRQNDIFRVVYIAIVIATVKVDLISFTHLNQSTIKNIKE